MTSFFVLIAPHLQLQILEKLSFPEFVQFLSCSRQSNGFSKLTTLKRMPLFVNSIFMAAFDDSLSLSNLPDILKTNPARFYFNQMFLKPVPAANQPSLTTAETLQSTIDMFETHCIIGTQRLEIFLQCECDPAIINQLLKAAKPFKFEADFDEDSLPQVHLDEVSHVSLNFAHPIPFALILNVKSPSIYTRAQVSPDDLNKFFKQWLDNVRNIHYTSITGEFPIEQDQAIFSKVPVRTIWHKSSASSSCTIPYQHYLHNVRFYALSRREETLFVKLNAHSFNVKLVDDVDSEFQCLLEQYNLV